MISLAADHDAVDLLQVVLCFVQGADAEYLHMVADIPLADKDQAP